MKRGEHVYLNSDNAEELLPKVIEFMKQKEHSESRHEAFEDCTKYWTSEVEEILKGDYSNGVMISRIRKLFNIEPLDE